MTSERAIVRRRFSPPESVRAWFLAICSIPKRVRSSSQRCFLSAFVAFVELKLVPAWLVVLIISREFLVTGLRLLAASRGEIVGAGFWGKHKTVTQLLTIIVLLGGLSFREDFSPRFTVEQLAAYNKVLSITSLSLISIVAFITVLSGAIYFYQHRKLLLSEDKA